MEGFFYEACRLDYISTLEIITRRYSNIDFIMQMPVSDFYKFLKLAKEKEQEERIFVMWTQQLPFMSKDNFTSFNDYKDSVTGKNIDTRSTAEINEDIDEIEKKLAGR